MSSFSSCTHCKSPAPAPGVNTPQILRPLNSEAERRVRLGSSKPYMYGCACAERAEDTSITLQLAGGSGVTSSLAEPCRHCAQMKQHQTKQQVRWDRAKPSLMPNEVPTWLNCTRKERSSAGARKFLVVTDAPTEAALPKRLRFSYVIVPPGTRDTSPGRPESPVGDEAENNSPELHISE